MKSTRSSGMVVSFSLDVSSRSYLGDHGGRRLDARRVENSSPAHDRVDVDGADAHRTAPRKRVRGDSRRSRHLTPAERRSSVRLAGGDPDRVLADPFDEVIVLCVHTTLRSSRYTKLGRRRGEMPGTQLVAAPTRARPRRLPAPGCGCRAKRRALAGAD